MSEKKRNIFTGTQKAKVALEAVDAHGDPDRLYAKIGQLNMELNWLKKSLGSDYRRTASLDRRRCRACAIYAMPGPLGGVCPEKALTATA